MSESSKAILSERSDHDTNVTTNETKETLYTQRKEGEFSDAVEKNES